MTRHATNNNQVQTKFSPAHLQDLGSAPYYKDDPIRTQVHTSVLASLNNFATVKRDEAAYLDAVLLHNFLPDADQTLLAWRALEELVPHRIRLLGVSNVALDQLKALVSLSKVKPSVVQNRFYANTNYDKELRAFCVAHDIQYQA